MLSISFSFRLYLHAFIIIPPLIIRKSRELTIENKPPGGFTPPSWASEKRKMDEKLSGQLRRLNPERSKSRKPMAAINSSQKSLPCVQESKLIRTRNQLLSFPLLSFFFFFFLFQKNASRVFIIPFRNVRAPLIFLRDIKPEECGNGGIYIYIRRNGISCLARKKVTLRMRYREGEAIVKK